MTGSIKWFVYTADDGSDFAIKLDESNTEAINGGTQDYVDGLGIIYSIPKNVTPRRCVFASADNTVRRECVALTNTIYAGVTPGTTITDTASGQTLSLTLKKGERIKLPRAADTGQQDGDAT